MMDANGKRKELLKACIYVYYTRFKNKTTRKRKKKREKYYIIYIIHLIYRQTHKPTHIQSGTSGHQLSQLIQREQKKNRKKI